MKVNYYEILGVDRSASDQEIRDRFRKLARENHPDRYRGPDKADAERKFQTLTEAVNVLTNSAKRRQHDDQLVGGGPRGPADFAQVAKAYLSKGAKAFHYLAMAAARIPAYTRQAVQAIESAVQREPMNPLYLKDAGMLCKRAGLLAKAERYFEETLKWDASNLDAQTGLAELRETKEAGKGGFSIFGKR